LTAISGNPGFCHKKFSTAVLDKLLLKIISYVGYLVGMRDDTEEGLFINLL